MLCAAILCAVLCCAVLCGGDCFYAASLARVARPSSRRCHPLTRRYLLPPPPPPPPPSAQLTPLDTEVWSVGTQLLEIRRRMQKGGPIEDLLNVLANIEKQLLGAKPSLVLPRAPVS